MSSTNIYSSPLCSCVLCHEVRSAKGIHSHFITKHTKSGNEIIKRTSKNGTQNAIKSSKERQDKRIDDYNRHPSRCLACLSVLPYERRKTSFVITRVVRHTPTPKDQVIQLKPR